MKEKQYWFRAKTYGWGWVPVTLQAWVILGMYVILLILRATQLQMTIQSQFDFLLRYLLEASIITILLIGVCYLTGEKPKWRWGEKSKKDRK